MSRYMNLTVIEVQDPNRILARETPGPTASAETLDYASFFKEMNEYFNNDVLMFERHSPKPNEICVALHSQNKKWHRVRIQEILTTLSGAKADCFFLDTGEKQMIQVVKIQKIPGKFLTIPFQVKVFALYGIQPLSLVLDPTLNAYKKPCKKWDKSATLHIKKIIQHASGVQAVIKSKGTENVLQAMIYLRFSGTDRTLSLNDELVKKGYATKELTVNQSIDEDTFHKNPLKQILSRLPQSIENSTTPCESSHSFKKELSSASNTDCDAVSDISNLSRSGSSSPSCDKNIKQFSSALKQNFCTNSKPHRNIQSQNASLDPPPNYSNGSQISSLSQLLSFHKRLQKNSDPLPHQKESGNDFLLKKSPNNFHDLRTSRLDNKILKDEKIFSPKENQTENLISTDTLSNHNLISKTSIIKSPQSVSDSTPKLYTANSLSQLLSFHKRLQKNSDPLPHQKESGNDFLLKKSPKNFLDLKTSHLDNKILKDEKIFSPKENQTENLISTDTLSNHNLISKTSIIKSPQSVSDSTPKLYTASALDNFLACHRKLANVSDKSSEIDLIDLESPEHTLSMPAKMIEMTKSDANRNDLLDNCFPGFEEKETLLTMKLLDKPILPDKCDSKTTLDCVKGPQIMDQSSLAQKSLHATNQYSNNESNNCYSNMLFSEFHSKDENPSSNLMDSDYNQGTKSESLNACFWTSVTAKNENLNQKISNSCENLSSINKDIPLNGKILKRENEENANSKFITDRQNKDPSSFTNDSSAKNIISESQSGPIFKEPVLASPELSLSAVNILNHSVSSKLLSSSPSHPILMLQNLKKALPLNSSQSAYFSKKCPQFASIDDSDLSEVDDDKLPAGSTAKSCSENNSNKKFDISEGKEQKIIDNLLDLKPTNSLQQSTNSEYPLGVCPVNAAQDFCLGEKSLSQAQSLESYVTAPKKKCHPEFENEWENLITASKPEDHLVTLSKIDSSLDFSTATPNLDQDCSTVDDVKSNIIDIGRLMHENKKDESQLPTNKNNKKSFELSPVNKSNEKLFELSSVVNENGNNNNESIKTLTDNEKSDNKLATINKITNDTELIDNENHSLKCHNVSTNSDHLHKEMTPNSTINQYNVALGIEHSQENKCEDISPILDLEYNKNDSLVKIEGENSDNSVSFADGIGILFSEECVKKTDIGPLKSAETTNVSADLVSSVDLEKDFGLEYKPAKLANISEDSVSSVDLAKDFGFEYKSTEMTNTKVDPVSFVNLEKAFGVLSKPAESIIEPEDPISPEDLEKDFGFEPKSINPSKLPVAKNMDVLFSSPVDTKTVPICELENTESPLSLNENLQSPSFLRDIIPVQAETIPMPALIDMSTDSDSELDSLANDTDREVSLPNETDNEESTTVSPFMSKDISSNSHSSNFNVDEIAGSDTSFVSLSDCNLGSRSVSTPVSTSVDVSCTTHTSNLDQDEIMQSDTTSVSLLDVFGSKPTSTSDSQDISSMSLNPEPDQLTELSTSITDITNDFDKFKSTSTLNSDINASSVLKSSTVKPTSVEEDFVSIVDIESESDFKMKTFSRALPTDTENKEGEFSLPMDSKILVDLAEDNQESPSKMPLLSESSQSLKSGNVSSCSSSDFIESNNSSVVGVTGAHSSSKFLSKSIDINDVLSSSNSTTESKASQRRYILDKIMQVASSTKRYDDCNILSLSLTADDMNKVLQSQTLTEEDDDNKVLSDCPKDLTQSLLPSVTELPGTTKLELFSMTDTCDKPNSEKINLAVSSKTDKDNLDIEPDDPFNSKLYKPTDLNCDEPKSKFIESAHKANDTISAIFSNNVQPVELTDMTASTTSPLSPSNQISLDKSIKTEKDFIYSEEELPNDRCPVTKSIKKRSMLDKLGVVRTENNVRDIWQENQCTESILLNDSVLFIAEKIPRPIYNLQDSDVPEILYRLLENENIQPKPIQAYSWGPGIRGKNIVGISPPGSGKTWSYIVPIIASLCQYSIYSDIKFSNGPVAVILVPTWKKAISVYEECKNISHFNREIIVEVIFGGGKGENKKSVKLLNGCHILVATLPCLQRMLTSKFTNLDRLCHLVIDDADILLQDFHKEIVDLMCQYRNVVNSRDKTCHREQVMAYGSKWTSYLDGFVKNALNDPVIIITDMIEAAVYGRIKQLPILCENSEQKNQLLKLLPQIIQPNEKIIIFANDDNCFPLQSLISEFLQKPVGAACNTLYKSEWQIIAADWKSPLTEKESYRILVCSDVALCDLSINDATCVVHYQMPKRKTHIGLRIQAMSNYYQLYNNKPPVKIAKSYILITDKDKTKIKSMRSFLMRSTDITNKDTWDFLSNIRQVEDLDPQKKLCANIKAFGKCRNKYQCNDRHCVVPSVDLNGANQHHIRLPTQGDVRVKILHVKSANNFYVRILEHQIGTHKTVQIHSDMATLIMGMAVYYSTQSNRKVLDQLTTGMLCVVNSNEEFLRVKVLKPYDNASKNTASLFFVDNGKVESHPICNLYQLADEFKQISFQAVEVFLCRLYPVDYDLEWTVDANLFSGIWVDSKMLYGKIRFVMDNTLWLDPLLERTFLKTIKTVTNGPSLRKQLISNNLAIDNPQHLIHLHKLFEGYIPKLEPICPQNTSFSTWEFNLENEKLLIDDDYENVSISYIFNPEHFYVQKLDMKICLNDMMLKIQEKMSLETEEQSKREWLSGMHCLSKSSIDSRWCRVIILSLTGSKAVVHFVDFGNIEEVCIDELRTLHREFMYLPSQAIECKLAHIKPIDDEWPDKCNDIMYYMSQTADNLYKTLAANVVSEKLTEGMMPQYFVNLLDTSNERVINFGQELIWWKMALPKDDHFQCLFLEPVNRQMFYPSASKIAEMCAVLYYEQTSYKQYAELMMSYLKVCIIHPEKMIKEDVPRSFLKLLSYMHDPDAFSSIVDYMKLLMLTPSLFDNLLSCGILQNLGQILKMHDDVTVLNKTLELIRYMAESKENLIDQISSLNSGLFSTLCEIVKSVYPNEIRISVCQLLESFCLVNQKCTENLIELQVCPLHLSNVLETEDHDLTETYLSLLLPVSLLDSGLCAIKREKPMEEIIKLINTTTCEKCLYKCLVVLKRLSDKSRKNKTLLLEQNLVLILSNLKTKVKDAEILTLCQEFLDDLSVKVLYNNQECNGIVSNQIQSTNERFQVFWCQNKFRLLITLKISNCEWAGCDFFQTSIDFGFFLNDGVKQSVHYELFDEVVVEKCAVSLRNKEVILSLCKAEIKYWPRLLQDKYNKPQNLFVDFDKIEDSDDSESEEVEADEENPFTLQVVVKKNPAVQIVKKLSIDNEDEAVTEKIVRPVDSVGSEEDSLENSDFEEYDRFNIFNTKYS